jgi:hypothetical protein
MTLKKKLIIPAVILVLAAGGAFFKFVKDKGCPDCGIRQSGEDGSESGRVRQW